MRWIIKNLYSFCKLQFLLYKGVRSLHDIIADCYNIPLICMALSIIVKSILEQWFGLVATDLAYIALTNIFGVLLILVLITLIILYMFLAYMLVYDVYLYIQKLRYTRRLFKRKTKKKGLYRRLKKFWNFFQLPLDLTKIKVFTGMVIWGLIGLVEVIWALEWALEWKGWNSCTQVYALVRFWSTKIFYNTYPTQIKKYFCWQDFAWHTHGQQ